MRRWRGLDAVPSNWGRCVVTIGIFDGVHRGHQQLIASAVGRARELGLPCVLLTFDPHPAEVVRPGSHPAQLTTLRRRAELVEELGVDVFCVLPFTSEVAKTPPDTFAHEVLVERLHAAAVVVGENFTFGHRAAGDVALLRTLGRRFGFVAEGADLLARNELTFSSTYIRSCLSAGDVTAAAEALGRPYRLEGIVVRGDGRGRELGFPTANLSMHRYAAVPGDGVYACRFQLRSHGREQERRVLSAAVSVGTNPTFSGEERRVEAYVLDVDEDFYGEHVELDFVAKLRDMERYDEVQALIDQMSVDVRQTREILTGQA
ncbi:MULTISPECIES: bifunctional riboflavin kinase/FAD synthetase [Actinoalloteichus]|uniref:Riboflavin biosynthesis protein n=1 Tax=Actinoalloteichus fjordicus TaxID=1612552 RepID=A0AAC9LA00_9PSEU|nr:MULTISPECIES: bifunctional riboflavin kinase/FAD synthetase [Actinoalloteichus]APU13933.1 FMN adenylyltransferase /riboflavin kinase [Actinoalloteichus fjordicus]APU19879.1 FMN adenylyltransferase /riboflavin kinase [Actinoalloteichus sp. GBA129-24]